MKERQIEVKPTVKQYQAWVALNDPEIKEIHFGGGAGGGKSWLGCESRIARAYAYPGYKSFIGRNELTRLMASSFVTFTKVCKFHKIPSSDWKLNGKYNYIEFRNGSRIDLLDLSFKPSDPMYERLGSLEYTDGWLEEAGEIPFMAVDILKSRVGRHKNEEFGLQPDTLYTYNPNKGWVYKVYKNWKEGKLPKDVVFIQSLYGDNPHTAKIYGEQLNRITNQAMRQRLKDGDFDYDDSQDSLVDFEALTDTFSNTIDSGHHYMTVDVARLGKDRSVFTFWDGLNMVGVKTFNKQSIDVTVQKIKDYAAQERIPYSNIIIDEDGVGGGVVDNLFGVKGFTANSRAIATQSQIQDRTLRVEHLLTNTPVYANLKAQCGWKLAELINERKIAFKVPDYRDAIIEEISSLLRDNDVDGEGKKRLRKKEEVKMELGRSPDIADAILMRAYFEVANDSTGYSDETKNNVTQQQTIILNRTRNNMTQNSSK